MISIFKYKGNTLESQTELQYVSMVVRPNHRHVPPPRVDLKPEDIKEFQRLWKQETGQDIDEETAEAYGQDIIGLVGSVVEWKKQKRPESTEQKTQP